MGKKAQKLHRMGISVQKLANPIPRRSGETASKRSNKGFFRPKMTLQDELFLVVILNTILRMGMESTHSEIDSKEAP